MSLFLLILMVVVYAIFGIGVARAEKSALKRHTMEMYTFMFWPLALLLFALFPDVLEKG